MLWLGAQTILSQLHSQPATKGVLINTIDSLLFLEFSTTDAPHYTCKAKERSIPVGDWKTTRNTPTGVRYVLHDNFPSRLRVLRWNTVKIDQLIRGPSFSKNLGNQKSQGFHTQICEKWFVCDEKRIPFLISTYFHNTWEFVDENQPTTSNHFLQKNIMCYLNAITGT